MVRDASGETLLLRVWPEGDVEPGCVVDAGVSGAAGVSLGVPEQTGGRVRFLPNTYEGWLLIGVVYGVAWGICIGVLL